MPTRRGRKEPEEGKHQESGCGSGTGKDERKPAESQVLKAEGKHGKPGGAEVGSQGSESGECGTGKATVRQNREEKERKKQKAE